MTAHVRQDIKKFIKTIVWTKKVWTQEMYDLWRADLKDGDAVLVQEFIPASKSVYDFPFETWRFHPAKYQGDTVLMSFDNVRRVNLAGHIDIPWNKSFFTRIVPGSRDIEIADKEFVIGDAPIFEPEYVGCDRVVFLVEHDKDRDSLSALGFAGYLFTKSDRGDIYHAFIPNFSESWLQDKGVTAKFLYSEKIDPINGTEIHGSTHINKDQRNSISELISVASKVEDEKVQCAIDAVKLQFEGELVC